VLKAPTAARSSRLALCSLTADTLKLGHGPAGNSRTLEADVMASETAWVGLASRPANCRDRWQLAIGAKSASGT